MFQLSPRNFDHRSQGTFHLFQQMLFSSSFQVSERQLSFSNAWNLKCFFLLSQLKAMETLSTIPEMSFVFLELLKRRANLTIFCCLFFMFIFWQGFWEILLHSFWLTSGLAFIRGVCLTEHGTIRESRIFLPSFWYQRSSPHSFWFWCRRALVFGELRKIRGNIEKT